MRTSTGRAGRRLAAAALAAMVIGACGRPAPADDAQSAAPDPAAQATTPPASTNDAAVPADQNEQGTQAGAVAEQADAADGSMAESAAGSEPAADAAAADEAAADESPVDPAPVLTADQVVGVVDSTPGRAGVRVTSQDPIVAPTPTTAPPVVADTMPTGTGGVHVVQPGDTLSAIAETYGVSIQAIVDANGLVDPDNLTAGDELQIPPPG